MMAPPAILLFTAEKRLFFSYYFFEGTLIASII